MIFRTIIDLPRYEASQCGVIRRAARSSITTGEMIPSRVLLIKPSKPDVVVIDKRYYRISMLVENAWQHVPIPPIKPSRRGRMSDRVKTPKDVRVITLTQHIAELRDKATREALPEPSETVEPRGQL